MKLITYKFKLYNNDKFRRLHALIETERLIWNYITRLQQLAYAIYGKYIPCAKLKSHIAKLRKRNVHWSRLNSQTVQAICERHNLAYQKFFKKTQKHPPTFKKYGGDGSLVFKQSGYSLKNNKFTIDKVGSYHFHSNQDYGTPRQIILKRKCDKFFLFVICESLSTPLTHSYTGIIGIDFGLKTFITKDTGEKIESPRFLFDNAVKLREIAKSVSTKVKGSNNRTRAKKALSRFYEKVSNQRDDWQWKLAHDLCKNNNVICIEDITLTEWVKRWGRKAGDIAIGKFIQKLEHVASKYNTVIVKINKWYASTQICSECGNKSKHKISLKDREWTCSCGAKHDRDVNAAKNIKRQGIVSLEGHLITLNDSLGTKSCDKPDHRQHEHHESLL
jgi:putative transposase